MAGGKSYYLENKYIDWFFRGQNFPGGTSPGPTTLYVALYTAAPSAAGGGTEVSTSGTGYARVAVTSSLANWAGTQGAGTTAVSSGTSGQTSNNNSITFGSPTASWGTIGWFGILDGSGNLWYWAPLNTAKTVNSGDAAPNFAPGALTVTES
jgi:hypothetical protein